MPADFNADPLLPLTFGQNQVFGEVQASADPADGFRFEFIPDLDVIDVLITNHGPDLVAFTYYADGGVDTLTIDILPLGDATLFTEMPTTGEPVDDISPGIHGMQIKTTGVHGDVHRRARADDAVPRSYSPNGHCDSTATACVGDAALCQNSTGRETCH